MPLLALSSSTELIELMPVPALLLGLVTAVSVVDAMVSRNWDVLDYSAGTSLELTNETLFLEFVYDLLA